MDKKLLDALNNVSDAIALLAETLDSKQEAKSSTGQALQTSDIGEKLKSLDLGIKELQKDTKEILKNQKTIMDMSKSKSSGPEDQISGMGSKPEKKKAIKDGVSLILMIAIGVLAIGLAFKLIGSVDFVSVLALAVALPLVAMAFEKIAGIQNISFDLVITTVLIATAITASSYILSYVQPVGIFQLLTSVFIAGMFGGIAFGIGNLIKGLKDANLSIFDLAKMAIALPIVMIAISAAIVGSSYLLNQVQPVGIFQLFTSIFIAAAFGVIAFGLGKLLQGIKEIKNPAQAALVAALVPLVLIGVSAAIMGSSMLLAKVQPIGLAQFFTTLLISIAFIPISFALPFISKAIEKVNFGKILMLPVTMVLISAAILGSSHLLSMVKPIDPSLLFNIVLQAISLSLAVMAISLAFYVLEKTKLDPLKAFEYGLSLVIISGAIMVSSMLISMGKYDNAPSLGWSIAFSFAILALSVPAIILGMVGLPVVIMGAIGIVVLAAAITAASYILAYIKPDFFYTLADAFAYFFKVLAGAVSFALRVIAPALKSFIDIVGDSLIKFVKNILPPIMDAVKRFFNEVVKPFMQFLVDSLPAIGRFISTIIESVFPLVTTLIEGFKGILEQIKGILETVGDIIQKIGNTIIGVVNSIADGLAKVGDKIIGIINSIGDKTSKIIDSMSGFVNSIGGTIERIVTSIVSGIESLANIGVLDLAAAGVKVVEFLATIGAALVEFTNSKINVAFMNSIYGMFSQLNSFIGNLATFSSASVVNAPALIAKGIDLLANSISKLNSVIDVEKLSVLNKMTGGIILMSLMDPTQFEAVMTAFEKKASIFVETINKLEGSTGGTSTSERASTKGGGIGTKMSVPSQQPQVSLADILLEVQKISGSLGSIASDTNSIQTHIIEKDEKTNLGTSKS